MTLKGNDWEVLKNHLRKRDPASCLRIGGSLGSALELDTVFKD